MKKKLVIFASGTLDGGGTGAENLIQSANADVVAVISNYEHGGVRIKMDRLSVPFIYFSGPYTEEGYREFVEKLCQKIGACENDLWYALSGWFKKVFWLHPARTFNIHSAPLPQFGGKGMWGEKLHRAVWDSYKNGEITESEIIMHFVTEKYDDGPIFFRHHLPLDGIESFDAFEKLTRQTEHVFQPEITQLVIERKISWDGVHSASLAVPLNYRYL